MFSVILFDSFLTSFQNYDAALKMGDGLAVLGFFIEKDSENDVSGLFISLFLMKFYFCSS